MQRQIVRRLLLQHVVFGIGLEARGAREATITRFGERVLAQKVWMRFGGTGGGESDVDARGE